MSQHFYFIRHGQTDLNAKNDIHSDEDVGLNAIGRRQAETARLIIEKLPIATICVSPLKRTQETAEIISANLSKPKVVIQDLRECNGHQWLDMIEQNKNEFTAETKEFMDRAFIGIYESLKHAGPVLIVAHGGIHWAMCHNLSIQNHERVIDNCVPVLVSRGMSGWEAKTLMLHNS